MSSGTASPHRGDVIFRTNLFDEFNVFLTLLPLEDDYYAMITNHAFNGTEIKSLATIKDMKRHIKVSRQDTSIEENVYDLYDEHLLKNIVNLLNA